MANLLPLVYTLIGVLLGGLLSWFLGLWQLARLKEMVLDRRRVCLNEEFELTRVLVAKIRRAHFKPDVIFAVSPGGGMIAEWISRVGLGDFRNPIPVRSICVHTQRSGAGVQSDKASVKESLDILTAGFRKDSKVLLVNDISRGGATLEETYRILKEFFQEDNIMGATLFSRPAPGTTPKFCAVETVKEVQFDWKLSSMV